MRHLFYYLCVVLINFTLCAHSQSVTKFLGIPIDGTKREMTKKLINKGFTIETYRSCLKGEFNGGEVYVHIVDYKNNVYRIVVEPTYGYDETETKIRYNSLCRQFNRSKKYEKIYDSYFEFELDDDIDISYEIKVENKRLDAAYYQINKDTLQELKIIHNYLNKTLGNYNIPEGISIYEFIDENLSIEQIDELYKIIEYSEKRGMTERVVWFTIKETEHHDKFKIFMYYDNKININTDDDI